MASPPLTWRECRVVMLVSALLAVPILLLEPTTFSLLRGSHFNWVPMHSLALVKHSTPATGLVGYACRIVSGADGSGQPAVFLDYFNRYPVVFAVLAKLLLLPFAGSTAGLLLASKQLMNLLFVLTAAGLYLLGRSVSLSRFASLAGLLTALASPLWLHFRPMFHFDQPGLLGLVATMVAYPLCLRPGGDGSRPRTGLFLAISLAAVSLGRSYMTLMLLASLGLVLSLRPSPSARLRLARRGIVLAAVASTGLVVMATGYAAAVEALINHSPLTSVSVVASAGRRLGFATHTFAEDVRRQLDWGTALTKTGESLQLLVPWMPLMLVLILLVAGAAVALSRRPRVLLAALTNMPSPVWELSSASLLASLLWLVVFKNLVSFHSYTLMFLIPALFLLSACAVQLSADWLCSSLAPPGGPTGALADKARLAAIIPLVLLLAIAVDRYGGSLQGWRVRGPLAHSLAAFYAAVDRFDQGAPGPVLRDKNWVPNSPYAQCLMLDSPLVEGASPELRAHLSRPPSYPFPVETVDRQAKRSRRLLRQGSLRSLLRQ